MFTQEDRNYVKALLVDRQTRLTRALYLNQLQDVLQPDADEVRLELDQVSSVLDKIRKVESTSN